MEILFSAFTTRTKAGETSREFGPGRWPVKHERWIVISDYSTRSFSVVLFGCFSAAERWTRRARRLTTKTVGPATFKVRHKERTNMEEGSVCGEYRTAIRSSSQGGSHVLIPTKNTLENKIFCTRKLGRG